MNTPDLETDLRTLFARVAEDAPVVHRALGDLSAPVRGHHPWLRWVAPLAAAACVGAALVASFSLGRPDAPQAPTAATSPAPASAPVSAPASAPASPSATPTCHHTPPASAPRQLLAEGSPGGEGLGNRVAVRISEVIQSHESLGATARPTSGLPLGLDQGIVGVAGDASTGLSVVVDSRRIDGAALLHEIRSGLPSNLTGAVEVVSSCRSAAELTTAWRAVSTFMRGSGASGPGSLDLDPATETIEVLLGTPNAATASAVEALAAPGVIHVSGDAGLSRGSRVVDTPTPRHRGGARHTSSK